MDCPASQVFGKSGAGSLWLPVPFGVYLAAVSLAEYFGAWQLVFPKYIVTSALDRNAEFVGRGRGPLLHPIGNGILLAICLAARRCGGRA